MGNLYQTTTTISPNEIERSLYRGKVLMGTLAIKEGNAERYLMKRDDFLLRKEVYLYCYAIETWLLCDDTNNYLTQDQLKQILSKLEQLFKSCNC